MHTLKEVESDSGKINKNKKSKIQNSKSLKGEMKEKPYQHQWHLYSFIFLEELGVGNARV